MAESLQLEITCQQVWKEISDYYDGDLSPELRERVRRHLEVCVHCLAVYDGLRNTISLVAHEHAFELPADLSQRLCAKLKLFQGNK